MTSILNNKIGVAHKFTPALVSVSEPIILRPKDSGTERIIGGTDSPCITTSYTITMGDTVQFSATLGTELYAYVLGNNPYTFTIQGLMFSEPKANSDDVLKPVDRMIATFEKYKASSNNAPVRVMIGAYVFTALLENIVVTGSAEQGADIFTFKVVLRGIKGA